MLLHFLILQRIWFKYFCTVLCVLVQVVIFLLIKKMVHMFLKNI